MRIGLFVDMYLPHVSGVTNHVRLYKRHFEDLGHEVYLFTFGNLDYEDDEPNVIRSTGMPWGETGWRMAVTFSQEARQLIPTLDVAHVHHPFQSGVLALSLCRKHGIPVVFTNHTRYDLYGDAYAGFVPPTLRDGFVRTTLRSVMRRCDLVIAPAASIAQWLSDYCGFDATTVVPNGIDIARFATPTEPETRSGLGFEENDFVLCYSGRLGPEKNTELLAEEFAAAAETASRLRLLVVGDGPSRDAAWATLSEHGLSDRALFVGMQPYERVPGYLAVADAFVTASVSEVHPLVVLEAMAAGLPVIAIASPGISDTVADGVSGLLAPDAREGGLAERMRALASDQALHDQLRAGAQAAVGAYSFEHTADVVLGHYERLVVAARP